MNIKKLSIVIPAYNEAETIQKIIQRVIEETHKLGIEEEIIVVDDASTDKTAENVRVITGAHIRVLQERVNRGKGYAIRQGLSMLPEK